MIPASCICFTCWSTSCLTANGVHLGGCFLGSASPVSIWSWTRSVSSCSPSSRQKAMWWLAKKSQMAVFSWFGSLRLSEYIATSFSFSVPHNFKLTATLCLSHLPSNHAVIEYTQLTRQDIHSSSSAELVAMTQCPCESSSWISC